MNDAYKHPIDVGLVAQFAGYLDNGYQQISDSVEPFRRCTNHASALYTRDSISPRHYSLKSTQGNSYTTYTSVDNRLKLNLPITMTCWIKSVGTITTDSSIAYVSYNDPATNPWISYGFDAVASGGYLRSVMNSAGSLDIMTTNFNVNTFTRWTHIGQIISSTKCHLYIDGGLWGYTPVGGKSNPNYTSTSLFRIGNPSGTAYSNLLVANVKIWNLEFTPSMLHIDMVAGRSDFPQLTNNRFPYYLVGESPVAAGGALEGSSTLTFSITGDSVGTGALSSSSTLTFTTSGNSVGTGALYGSSSLTFTTAADLTSGTELSGSTSLTFTTTGDLVGAGSISGASTLTFTDSGNVTGVGVLNASTTVDFSTSGLINGNAACVANATLDFSTSGLLGGTGTLLGNSSISFSLTGDLALGLVGSTSLAFTLTGNVVGIGAISGTSSLTFGISGGFAVDETGVLMDASPNIFWFGTIV